MPDPIPHLHAAHAALHNATRYLPTALHNLTHDQGGLPGHIAAWPTGHTATAVLEQDGGPDPHDPCRRALRTLDHDLRAITTTTRDLLHPRHPPPVIYRIAVRHHYATALLDLARTQPIPRSSYDQCDTVHHLAINIRNTLAQWAYTPTRNTTPTGLGLESPDWCANHARLNAGAEPVSTRAAADGHTLCDFCWSHLKARGQRPPRTVLIKRANGERLTEDIT